jgi:hypothetical protein
MTLLPGLIDMHTHITSDPRYGGYRGLEFTDNFWTVVGVANAKKTLEAGFTTIRNVGSDNYDDVAIKQGIETGFVPGPRIVPDTYAIGATVRKLRKHGAEVIKFCATGGVFSKTDTVGDQQYDLAEMHARGAAGIKDAIRAGVDTIEHASLADPEAIALAKQHGTWFDMDIYDDDYILAEDAKNGVFAESIEKERMIGRQQRETFRAATRAGVKMIFGTDAGVYPNGDNARQFATMVQWGMTPMQAIQAATVSAAQALGRGSDVGALGAFAPKRSDRIEEIAPDRLVAENLLLRQSLDLMREHQPSIGFVDVIVRFESADVSGRLVIHGRDAELFRQIALATARELGNDRFQAAAGVEYVIDQQQFVLRRQLRDEIIHGVDPNCLGFGVDAGVGGRSNRDVVGMNGVVFQHLLYRNSDRRAAAPHGDQEGGSETAANNAPGEFHRVQKQGISANEEFIHGCVHASQAVIDPNKARMML